MKSFKLNISIFLSILLFTSCQKNDKLIGSWERYDDANAGMKVQVLKEGESFKAAITFATDSNKLLGFVEGDIKWKNIKKTTENRYEFEDLYKRGVIFTDKFEPSYALTNLEIISDDEIHTRVFSKGTEWIGTEQKWRRIVNK
jgi:hypothetical protein